MCHFSTSECVWSPFFASDSRYAVLSMSLFSGEYTAQIIKHYLQDAKLDTNLQSKLVPAEPNASSFCMAS